jgi:hypothetical protein
MRHLGSAFSLQIGAAANFLYRPLIVFDKRSVLCISHPMSISI